MKITKVGAALLLSTLLILSSASSALAVPDASTAPLQRVPEASAPAKPEAVPPQASSTPTVQAQPKALSQSVMPSQPVPPESGEKQPAEVIESATEAEARPSVIENVNGLGEPFGIIPKDSSKLTDKQKQMLEQYLANQSATLEKKQFLTIRTAEGSIYYIVIDHAASGKNVYFLKEVGEKDMPDVAAKPISGLDQAPLASGNTSALSSPKKDQGKASSLYVIIGAVLLLGGGFGYFYLQKKGKKADTYGEY